MTHLYVTLGKSMVIEKAGQKKPAIVLKGKVHDDLTYLEVALYTAMQYHISDLGNIEEYYCRQTLTNRAFTNGRLEDCLDSLREKGLVAFEKGEKDVAILYRLLAWRELKANSKSIDERLADYKLLRERHVPIRVAIQVYRPLRLTVLEQQILRRIRAVPGQNMYVRFGIGL